MVHKQEDDEVEIALEKILQSILHETKELASNKRYYSARVDLNIALSSVSPTLLTLMAKLSDKLAHTMPAALIGNIIASLVTNSVTTLQIDLGVVLSKHSLIEQFNDFAVACTYDELLRFKASAAAAALKNAKMAGIVAPKDGIIQVVADNFDATISSQNGLLNTHSLAMLLTVVDSHQSGEPEDDSEMFSRLTTEEARNLAIEDTHIERYRGPKKPDMPASEVLRAVLPLRVLAHQVVSLSRACDNDFDIFHEIVSDRHTRIQRVQYQACKRIGS